MSTHPSTTTGMSQTAKIIATLKACRKCWVAMPALVGASGSLNIHSRISDARRLGYVIEHKNERHGRAVHSFYRLK